MWNSYLALLAIAAFLRADYEIHRAPESLEQFRLSRLPTDETLTEQQKEWAEKAVRRYRASQEKKWQRWQEAMFEKAE